MIDARRNAVYDAEIRQLFALYDIRGDGAIQADEFCRSQLLIAEALGEDISELGIPVLPLSSGLGPLAPPPLVRTTSIDAMRNAGFHDVDLDGAECVGFDEFKRWQLRLLNASSKSAATKRRRLAVLIRELERRHSKAESRRCWTDSLEALEHAQTLTELEMAAAHASSIGMAVPSEYQVRLKHLQVADAMERARLRPTHEAAMATADTVVELQAAIEAAECILEADTMGAQKRRLAEMRAPFAMEASTLAGLSCEVEVTREHTVSALREDLATLLGTKAYRLSLACSSRRLEPATATLEACGIRGPSDAVVITFDELDPVREMSLVEFCEAGMKHGLMHAETISHMYARIEKGEVEEDEWRETYRVKLAKALELEEKKRAEEEARRRREEEHKAQARATRRAPFEALSFDELIARGVDLGVFTWAEATVISSNCSDELIERLSLLQTIQGLEAEKEALVTTIAGIEPECEELARIACTIKNEMEEKFGECTPELYTALDKLNRISKRDLDPSACGVDRPPRVVARVMEAVCRLFGQRPVAGDYWGPSKQLLRQSNFLDQLFRFDKDNISEPTIRSIQPFVDDEELSPDKVRRFSTAAEALITWVRAMYTYHHVAIQIEPLRRQLLDLEHRLEARIQALNIPRRRLYEVEEQLRELPPLLAALAPLL